MNTIEIFEKRSKEKRKNAIFMLLVAIVIIAIGMFMFMNQFREVELSLDEAISKLTSNQLKPDEREKLLQTIQVTQILNIITRIAFLIIIFFVAQIFLKLYRHNMNLSDFYFSCVDSWKINDEISHPKKKENFILLLKALYPNEIKLDIPNSPDIGSILNVLKKG